MTVSSSQWSIISHVTLFGSSCDSLFYYHCPSPPFVPFVHDPTRALMLCPYRLTFSRVTMLAAAHNVGKHAFSPAFCAHRHRTGPLSRRFASVPNAPQHPMSLLWLSSIVGARPLSTSSSSSSSPFYIPSPSSLHFVATDRITPAIAATRLWYRAGHVNLHRQPQSLHVVPTGLLTMPSTLLELPVEILQTIGQHVYYPIGYHNDRQIELCEVPFDFAAPDTNWSTLCSLSVTCRKLRSALEPLLFIRKSIHSDESLRKTIEFDKKGYIQ